MVLVQTLGSPVHDISGSTTHVVEHPSPLALFPSSQASVPRFRPSPQIGFAPELVMTQPASVLQVLEQPSPLAVLWSSHASSMVRVPSPHTSLTHGPVGGQ